MGRVAGSYGVRGWVKVAPDDGAKQGLVGAKKWWIGAEAYEVGGARVHGATVVAKLAGIENREQALALKGRTVRSEEHTSELQSQSNLVCRLLLEKKKT